MRPVRIITALLCAATAATLTLPAVPASAAPITVHVSPSPVVAGHTVTVSGSVGPVPADSACARGVTLISEAFIHTDDFAGLPAVFGTVKPDGTFTATTTIPRSRQAGSYSITGRCGGGNLGVSATLVVRAGPGTDPVPPTTTPVPAAPPTGPPIDQPLPAPTVTGPPNQPAATAAAQAASGWILPGLAALGSGTLAALGVWWLYRRRYPAGPSRQGRSGMAH